MINDLKKDYEVRMKKSVDALDGGFAKVRTGRAHPAILKDVMVPYYGADTPLSLPPTSLAAPIVTLTVRSPLAGPIPYSGLKGSEARGPDQVNNVTRISRPQRPSRR